jgi:hypothetical protein
VVRCEVVGAKGLWSVAKEALRPRGAAGVVSLGAAFAAALLEAVAIAVHLQDVDMMGKAIEEGSSETFRAENLGPLLEGQVRSDHG